MNIDLVVDLVKEKKGFRSTARDGYIRFIAEGVVSELEQEQGLVIDLANPHHLMLVVDLSEWRYTNRDSEDTPRHLKFRLHNLVISSVGDSNG